MFFHGGGGLSVMFVVTESPSPPPPLFVAFTNDGCIDDQFLLPKLT